MTEPGVLTVLCYRKKTENPPLESLLILMCLLVSKADDKNMHTFESLLVWFGILALLLPSCVIWGNLLKLSEPQHLRL